MPATDTTPSMNGKSTNGQDRRAPERQPQRGAAAQGNEARKSDAEAQAPRSLKEILDDLAKPIPRRLLETKRIQGNAITYIPWSRAQKVFNHYCRGFWEYRIVSRWQEGGDFMMTVEITVHAAEGRFTRQGTGREEAQVNGYGDVQSNAESMAFRRCCARWGLGLELYEK